MSAPAPSSELYKPYPFRWIFPLGQLVLCLFLFAIIVSTTRGLVPGTYAHRTLGAIAAFNLPGGMISQPMVIALSGQQGQPLGMDPFFWRAATWPVFNIVFWWIAGRATEALVSIRYRQLKPSISRSEAILGSLLTVFGIILLVGLSLDDTTGPQQADGDLQRFAAGGGLWAFLGALSVIARFRQWRLSKKMTTRVA